MQNNNRIEQLLKQSKRSKQSLSPEKKDMMLQSILNSATEEQNEKVSPAVSIVRKKIDSTEEHPLRRWMMIFAGGAAAVAVALVLFFQVQQKDAQEDSILANQNTNVQEEAVLGSSNTNMSNQEPAQPENENDTINSEEATNTNSEASGNINEQTEELQASPDSELENNTEESTNSAYPESSNQVAVDTRLEYFFLETEGRGGGWMVDYSLWTINRPSHLSDQRTSAPELEVYSLNETAMRKAAQVFGIPDAQMQYSNSEYNRYQFNLNNLPTGEGGDCINYNSTHTPQQRCVYVNNHGFVNLEQQYDAAQLNGQDEAFSYITRLTGLARDQFIVTDLTPDDTEYMKYDAYYTITPKYSSTPYLAFRPYQWTIALENGRLRSVYGALLSIHEPAELHPYEIVSESVAFDRLIADYKRSTTEPNFIYIVSGGNPWVEELESIPDDQVNIEISSVDVQYELFINRKDRDNDGKYTYRLLPVYRIVGKDKKTENVFQVYVDATSQEFIHQKYDLVRGAYELW